MVTERSHIMIRGARQHNLKNIDVDIPKDRMVVITGLSGSGKSSLAFDTLYAEGQRRYVESLSAYARQFLERLDKPDVDGIDGLSPAIAIEQKTAGHNPRSTVGTVTEIHDYIRLLFARVGTSHCHRCGRAISSQTIAQMLAQLLALPEGERLVIFAPIIRGQKGRHAKQLSRFKKQGFARVRIDGDVVDIDAVPPLDPAVPHDIDVVVDRLIVKPAVRNRLAESLELATGLSDGLVSVTTDRRGELFFSERSACLDCGISYPPFTPASFSFNSPHGACSECNGLGATSVFDESLIIPNPELSLREGAVDLWAHRSGVHFIDFLESLARRYGADIHTPFKDLPERFKQVLLYGSGGETIAFVSDQGGRRQRYEKTFEGLIPQLKRRYLETDSARSREEIRRYMVFRSCGSCGGSRLNPASSAVRVAGRTIADISAMTIADAGRFTGELSLNGHQAVIAERIIREIRQRLQFLEDVGLDYLTLGRSAATLSGGESQRIRLATQIGAKLTGVLYVLDEPSIGLHQRDNRRLLKTLAGMRDMGNTVLVVEHDEETILSADHVIDMGPGAGINGGRIVYSGPPDALTDTPESLTGQYLARFRQIAVPAARRPGNGHAISILGAAENNLKQIDVSFPLGALVCVTGVSGSGKSTLVLETLYRALQQHLHQARVGAGRFRAIEGIEHVNKVIHIDQSPIGKTPRSNPGTYTGLFSHVRELFARTPEARKRGYRPGRFSFNVRGGRCEACRGDGILRIEMHFLPDVYVTCDECRGARYNPETLDIRYKGKTIADILEMTVNQSLSFFERIRHVHQKLKTLVDVGVGYIRLGQPATTLSGGEAQRLKLARELSRSSTGRTVYILDEPTTGLHADDINKLLSVLNRLVDAGNTVIIIEHHLDVIKCADYLIDLGPEGGDAGGQVVGTGTPEQLAGLKESHTGRFLKKLLAC